LVNRSVRRMDLKYRRRKSERLGHAFYLLRKSTRHVEEEDVIWLNNTVNRHPSFHRYHRLPTIPRSTLRTFVHARSETRRIPLPQGREETETLRGHSFLAQPWQWTIRPPLCPRYINCLFEARWPPRIWLSPFPFLPSSRFLCLSLLFLFYPRCSFLLTRFPAFLNALSRT